MKAIEAFRDLVGGRLKKGKDFKQENFEIIEGKINPNATYYYTLSTCNLHHYNPDVVILFTKPYRITWYLYEIEP